MRATVRTRGPATVQGLTIISPAAWPCRDSKASEEAARFLPDDPEAGDESDRFWTRVERRLARRALRAGRARERRRKRLEASAVSVDDDPDIVF